MPVRSLLAWIKSKLNPRASPIDPSDSLTRFLFSDRDFRAASRLLKERAFRPREGDSDISVFRTTGRKDAEIWEVGARFVLPERKASDSNAKLHGRADFNAAAPISLGLACELQPPPPEHAVVSGWPAEKHERIQIAQELAARAFLATPPVPIS